MVRLLWFMFSSLLSVLIASKCSRAFQVRHARHVSRSFASVGLRALPSDATSVPYIFNGTVTIAEQSKHHVVVCKPPSVVCHHSEWSGSRRRDSVPEVPMLQRTREAVGERVNLVHRLDRGASGCLLLTKATSDMNGLNATATLQRAMSETAQKTYIALVRGEGIAKGRNFKEEGWFTVDRPIKDEQGRLNDAVTHFRFLAGQDNGSGTLDRARASLVLARPETGRWHQIRRHLNGIHHPILGDTTHGDNSVNKEWRNQRGMISERTCLHLARLEIPASEMFPQGIDVSCPLEDDMMKLLQDQLPKVLEEARQGLTEEGIVLDEQEDSLERVSIQLEVENAR